MLLKLHSIQALSKFKISKGRINLAIHSKKIPLFILKNIQIFAAFKYSAWRYEETFAGSCENKFNIRIT